MSDQTATQHDEALAAEWAGAMEEAEGGAGGPRVLNQDEIDSLLGFDRGAGGDGAECRRRSACG